MLPLCYDPITRELYQLGAQICGALPKSEHNEESQPHELEMLQVNNQILLALCVVGKKGIGKILLFGLTLDAFIFLSSCSLNLYIYKNNAWDRKWKQLQILVCKRELNQVKCWKSITLFVGVIKSKAREISWDLFIKYLQRSLYFIL